MIAPLGLPLVGAQQKEEQRVQNAGTAIKEILNVPDGIPQQLLDKAECVIRSSVRRKVRVRVRRELWPRYDDLPER